jgi:hypothetical protein
VCNSSCMAMTPLVTLEASVDIGQVRVADGGMAEVPVI